MIKKFVAGILLASLAVTAIVPATVSAAGGKNIVETAIEVNSQTGKFDTLLAAATCQYLGTTVTDILASPKKTLFAPTDAAFRRLGEGLGVAGGLNAGNVCTVDSLLGDGTLLKILGYHVIDGKVDANDATAAIGTKVQMLLGGKAKVTKEGGKLRIDGAPIITPDVRASNGLIHVVQSVLTPPSLG